LAKLGAREHLDEVRFGEVRAEHEQAGEVELARGQCVEQCVFRPSWTAVSAHRDRSHRAS